MTKKIVPILQVIFLLAFAWLIFLGISLFLKHNSDKIELFAPTTSEFRLTFDGKKLLDDASFNLLIDQEEDGLSDALNQLIKNENEHQKHTLIAGIDIYNSISYFTDHINGKRVQGLIFKLNNTKLWDKNGGKLIGKGSLTIRKETTGLLLFGTKITANELKHYSETTNFTIPAKDSKRSSLVELNYTMSDNQWIKKLTSGIDYSKNLFNSKGTIELNEEYTPAKFDLEHKFFHLHSAFVPKIINDTLHYFTRQLGLNLPNIKALSINYQGIELVNSDNGILPLPLADMIFEFNKNCSIAEHLTTLQSTHQLDIAYEMNTMILSIGEKTYYCKQLAPNAIYIGLTKNPKIINSTTTPFELKGKPSILLTIKGSKWITGMIKMNSSYSAIEEFVSKINNINIESSASSNSFVKYTIELEYKKDVKALNEVLKLMLKH